MSDLSPNEGSKIFYGGGINTAYFESVIAPKVKCKNNSHTKESIIDFLLYRGINMFMTGDKRGIDLYGQIIDVQYICPL